MSVSPERKRDMAKYAATEQGRAAHNRANQRYRRSDKGRATITSRNNMPERRSILQEAQKRYRSSDRGKNTSKLSYKLRQRRHRDMIGQIKLELGCVDCGYNKYAVALDFDHIDEDTKSFSISQKYGRFTDEKLFAEIDKCEVRCANCHRHRTWDDVPV